MNNLLTEISNQLYREGHIQRDLRDQDRRESIIRHEDTIYCVIQIKGETKRVTIISLM